MVLIQLLTALIRGTDPTATKVLRWSLMAAILFWVLVYRMAMQNHSLPDFVYVNF